MVGKDGQVVLGRQLRQQGRQLALQAFLLRERSRGAPGRVGKEQSYLQGEQSGRMHTRCKTCPRKFSYKHARVSTERKVHGKFAAAEFAHSKSVSSVSTPQEGTA